MKKLRWLRFLLPTRYIKRWKKEMRRIDVCGICPYCMQARRRRCYERPISATSTCWWRRRCSATQPRPTSCVKHRCSEAGTHDRRRNAHVQFVAKRPSASATCVQRNVIGDETITMFRVFTVRQTIQGCSNCAFSLIICSFQPKLHSKHLQTLLAPSRFAWLSTACLNT